MLKDSPAPEARRRFADLDHVPIGLAILDSQLCIRFWNRTLEQWTGLSRTTALGKPMADLNSEWSLPRYTERLAHLFAGGPPVLFSPLLHPRIVPLAQPSQRAFQVKATAVPSNDGGWWALLSVEDVTVLSRRIDELRELRNQQERLLREIHHRVKNNLNMISGLITIQKNQLPAGFESDAFDDLQSRIVALAEIHDILYRSQDLSRGSPASYLEALATLIDRNLAPKDSHRLEMAFDPKIALKTDTTVLLGLIQAELMTNALKYGLSADHGGWLRVSLQSVGTSEIEYRLEHSGDRLPVNFDPATSEGLGMVLIKAYTAQLGSTLQWMRGNPTQFWIRFST